MRCGLSWRDFAWGRIWEESSFTVVKTGCLLHDSATVVQSESGTDEFKQIIAEDISGQVAQR